MVDACCVSDMQTESMLIGLVILQVGLPSKAMLER